MQLGSSLVAQEIFGSILEMQMSQFQLTATLETLDQSMEVSSKITEENIKIEEDQATHVKI